MLENGVLKLYDPSLTIIPEIESFTVRKSSRSHCKVGMVVLPRLHPVSSQAVCSLQLCFVYNPFHSPFYCSNKFSSESI